MTTSEVWRVECEGGEVVTATVRPAREGGSVAVCGAVDVWRAERVDSVPYYASEASGDSPRGSVTALAGRGGLSVVAVLAPGEPTRAEARTALDEMHRRVDAAEAERDDLSALLARAARGELPRCECWCGCSLLGTHEAGSGAMGYLCDGCLAKHEPVANDRHDRGDWRDLPHAAALRAAMGGGA